MAPRTSPQTYFPYIRRYAAQYHVPADLLAAQIDAESGFDPNAVSPAGAIGISQFMPATARGFGIDPHDPVQSIEGQARYMHNLLMHYNGDVRLALAAYNAGEGAVDRYHGVPPYSETQHYIQTIQQRRSRYPGLARGSAPAGGGLPATGPAAAPGAPAGPVQPAAGALVQQGDPLGDLGASINAFAQQTAQNFNLPTPPMLAEQTPGLFIQQPSVAPQTPQAPQTPATGPAPGPGSPTRAGRYFRPTDGTHIIGTPYQGTHKPGATTAPSWESDNAIDIAVPLRTPIYAVANGTVTRTRQQTGQYTAGWTIHLAIPGNEFFYGHLSRVTVRPGQRVRAGQVIGYSGEANGVQHLHFGAENGNPLDLFGYGRR